MPNYAVELHEETWHSYPYCRTVLSNPKFMRNDFYIMLETFHGTTEADSNPHLLTDEAMENLKTENIDPNYCLDTAESMVHPVS